MPTVEVVGDRARHGIRLAWFWQECVADAVGAPRRGWEVVGIGYAPRAIDEARRRGITGATFLVGDATDLPMDHTRRMLR